MNVYIIKSLPSRVSLDCRLTKIAKEVKLMLEASRDIQMGRQSHDFLLFSFHMFTRKFIDTSCAENWMIRGAVYVCSLNIVRVNVGN